MEQIYRGITLNNVAYILLSLTVGVDIIAAH